MHLVIANQWFSMQRAQGGVAGYNRVLASELRDRKNQVTVVSTRRDRALPAFSEEMGIRVHRLLVRDAYRWRRLPCLGRYVRPLQQLTHSYRVARLLHNLHRQQPIDVVEFADVNAEGFFYARHPVCAVVIRCHTPTFVLRRYYDRSEMPFDTRLISWCEKDAIRRAHALSAPSEDMARTIATECALAVERISVIANALPPEAFQISSLPRRNGHFRVLCVGRLERAKGVVLLADAIPAIVRDVPSARFAFVGEDRRTGDGTSQRAELQRQLERAGASPCVEFAGPVSDQELADWYAKADVCLVPSLLYESFSYTSAQAMAAGKPVVASRIGGIPETVQDGVHGILIRPGQADELAQAVIRLAGDVNLREAMGRAGREWAALHFSSHILGDKTLEVYEMARQVYRRTRSQ